ncbi:MAG: hypothetical protein ACLT3C_03825 [Peptococcus niger]
MAKKKRRVNPRRMPVTKADLERRTDQVIQYANITSITVALMAAHDAFGFGPVRMERLMSRMMQLYSDYNDGNFTLADSREWLKDYAGIGLQDIDKRE